MVVQAIATSHPQLPHLPVVDYTLVLAMTPSLILGLVLGVLVNTVISQWLLNLLIIAIWTWSCIRLTFSYRQARLKEKEGKQQGQQLHGTKAQLAVPAGAGEPIGADGLPSALTICCEDPNGEAADDAGSSKPCQRFRLTFGDPSTSSSSSGGNNSCCCSSRICSFLSSFLVRGAAAVHSWASCQPWWTMLAIGLLFSFFIACEVIKGAVTPTCSTGYWAVMGVMCGVSVVAGLGVSAWLLRESKKAQANGGVLGVPDDLPTVVKAVASHMSSPSSATGADQALATAAGSDSSSSSNNNGRSSNANKQHSISSSSAKALPEQQQGQHLLMTSIMQCSNYNSSWSSSSSSNDNSSSSSSSVKTLTEDLLLGSVVHWTKLRLGKIHGQMLVAGLMLGAWPLSPIVLAIPGMHPQVGAGTSKIMLFLMTGGAGLSFIAASNINLSYMLVYGLTNAVVTPIGVWAVDKLIKRNGRASVIVMLTIVRLAACVVLQAVLQAVPSLINLAHGLPRAGFMAQPMCEK